LDALNPDPGEPKTSLLMPVFQWDGSLAAGTGHYTIVGFARFVVNSVQWENQTITGNFVTYRVKSGDAEPGLTNFGVRAIVLKS
jgi:hypothetical protein